jgi:hypothetical protein
MQRWGWVAVTDSGGTDNESLPVTPSPYDTRAGEGITSSADISSGSQVGESVASVPRLLDAIDKQNKRLAEIRDAVATIDWAFIRGTGLGLSRSTSGNWVRGWELGDATEG